MFNYKNSSVFCNIVYKFNKEMKSDFLNCAKCGDNLLKSKFLNLKQIIALIPFASFVLPILFLLTHSIINEIKNQNVPSRNYLTFILKLASA